MYPTIPKNTAKNGLRADRNEYTGVLFFRTGQLYLKDTKYQNICQ